MSNPIETLLQGPVRVVNVGLVGFARDLAAHGEPVAQVDWVPPAGGRPELLAALTPALLAHRDFVFERHFRLPMEL